MEKREVLVASLGAIAGVAFVDQAGDGSATGDPPVLVDNNGDLVAPGTPGAQGISVQLFEDTNGDSLFDVNDQLIGTDITDADGNYRFDGLSVGTYFLTQQNVPQLNTPASVTVQVTNEAGTRTELIDDYTLTTQSVTADPTTPVNSSSIVAPEAIGGARDVQVTLTSVGGQITVFADDTTDTLSIGSLGSGVGSGLLQYDGNDGSLTLDATGLGSASLSGGAPADPVDPSAGIVVLTRAQTAGDDLFITIHSDATNSSTATIPIPQDATTFVETFVPFSSFAVASGAGANFNDVGAIEATVGLSADNDAFVSIVEAIRPDVVTANYSNILPITLGGEIFLDTFSAGQNNGFREGTEAGVTGVTVQLHQLAGANDVLDPTTSLAIATTTSGANGAFSFANLDPGHYAVAIPASQFQNGAVLFGFSNSTGNDPAPDPDNDVDGDDNGTTLASTDVITGTITLESNSEPINDDDTDPNTNTTLDLGFFPQVDLSISKTLNAAASSVVAGGNAVFDIVVQNAGPLSATSIEVEDVIPAGLTFSGIQNASGSFTTNVNGSTVTVEIGTLPSGGQASFQLTTDIASNQTADVTNTATVDSTEVDTDVTNNSDDELLDLIESDLRITKQDAPDPVNAGSQLTYTITVTNDGPDTASGVQVSDPLPVGVDFNSGDVDGQSNLVIFDTNTRTVTASVGSLANGASSIITLVVDVAPDAVSPLSNAATVTASPNTDPDQTNNSASADTDVERQVDVGVAKTVTGTPIAGQSVTYTIDVTNAGPSQARGITVVDTLDANLTFDAASFNGGANNVTVTQNGQQLTFDVGTLDPSTNASFTFDVDIASSATGSIDNLASVTTTDTDSNAANDTSNVAIAVQQQVDLILTKDVDLATAVPGQDQLVYTFTITHDTDSSSDASSVVLTDTLPAGVVGAVINAPNATTTDFTNNTVTVEFASIPVGTSQSFTVTVDTDPAATGTVTNTGTITSAGTDIDTANNTDDAVTTLTPNFDVTVAKSVDNASPGPTESIVYTVDLTNTGPSTAPSVVLSDTIPAGLTFVSGTLNGQSATVNGSDLSFPAITLAPSGTATATLNFTVDASSTGTITNTASVPDLSADGESNANNNSDTADITIVPLVDLAISKAVSATDAQAGDNLTYTIDVTNSGPSNAENVTVTDTLPSGLNFVSGTGPNNATLTAANGVVSFAAGTVDSGDSFQLTIIVSIPAGTSGDHVNSVAVTTTTNENITTNNAANVTTTVDPLTSSISGVVYVDENNNGIQDAGEEVIPGVLLTLTGTDAIGNAVNATATTDANGNYNFANLAAGTYTVTQTQPVGFRDGIESAGTGATASVADNVFSNIALGQATSAIAFNFGELGQPLSKRRFLASTT